MTADAEVSPTLRRTVIIDGPLAFKMRRTQAAYRGEFGLQIFTLPQLAARLAGGFAEQARGPELNVAVHKALDAGAFARIDTIRGRPGMVRAASRTLSKIWMASFDVGQSRLASELGDLALIESRVREQLPPGLLAPNDLCNAAIARLKFARAVLGPVSFEGIFDIAPVWRPLLEKLSREVDLSWTSRAPKPAWLDAVVIQADASPPSPPTVVSCADPRAEAVEALRWARELIVNGVAQPNEIAICAASPETWDEYFLALSRDAELPLHFTHGTPALACQAGQACAALADVLLNGLSQERVRRLLLQVRHQSRVLKNLPSFWQAGLEPGAALFELDQWRKALELAAKRRTDGLDSRAALMPVLELLAGGIAGAERAGDELLGTRARQIWLEALRRAPHAALAFALREVRVPDESAPVSSPIWCPVDHLVGAPRRFTRFVGLTTRSWPRRISEDPLMPTRVVPLSEIEGLSIRERDEAGLAFLLSAASGAAVLSFARRDNRGSALTPSPLLPQGSSPLVLRRTRIPLAAFSESDRLLARPRETVRLPVPASATRAWKDWRKAAVTDHDGLISAGHPAIETALGQVQSATSLRLLFRDPLAYLWRYALGWQEPSVDDRPLERDNRAFGVLVHALLKRTVDHLEPTPGLGSAREAELLSALDQAILEIRDEWPLEHPVPPLLLWDHTLAEARELAHQALKFDVQFEQTTVRSYAEAAFGEIHRQQDRRQGPAPWPPDAEVIIPGTTIRVRGEIDRLDLLGDGGVRVTDYKTGKQPRNAEKLVLDGGRELQRVIYAIAVRRLIPDARDTVIARLVYLASKPPTEYTLFDVDGTIQALGLHVASAVDVLRRGLALTNAEAQDDWSSFRIALPSAQSAYFKIKASSFSRALGQIPHRTAK